MPYNSDGTFTDVAGAITASPGATIQSAVWDAVHEDMGNSFAQVMGELLSIPKNQNKNILFGNGSFEVWQRGAGASASISLGGVAPTVAYTADRWYLNTNANQACTIAAVAGLTTGSILAAKVQRNNAQTGVGALTFGYPLDTESCYAIRGNKVTLSFTAKAGANFSPTSGTLTASVNVGTGTPVKFTVGYTGGVVLATSNIALTMTATQYIIIGTVAAGTTIAQAEVTFTWTPVGTAGADDSFTIDDVQLEIQTTADYLTTPYDRVPYSTCLQDCKQHFQKTYAYGAAPTTVSALGALQLISAATSRCGIYWQMPSPARIATPTYTTYSPLSAVSANWADLSASTSLTVTATSTSQNGIFFVSATAAAIDRLIAIHATMDAGI